MRKLLVLAALLGVICFAVPAFATNGDNIIGVGAISRSMGGVGAAAPQDAISAVFGNPAAMCYIPCESSEVDFAATLFVPKISGRINAGAGDDSANSQGLPYAFPAIGIYTPITPDLRFGLAAYGVSGLGVDYKDTNLKGAFGFPAPGRPRADIKTDLQIMKFSPNLAYKVLPNLSVGAALQVNWAQLDLGEGSAHTFSFGTQVGVIYKPIDPLSLGVTYQTAQLNRFRRVYNFDAGLPSDTNGNFDNLKLEQPQQVVLGVAYDVIPNKLLLEVNEKWINWSGADGYKDFDWRDQYVTAVGIQGRPLDWLALRAGYNYGKNPVKVHNDFNPGGLTSIQGTNTPTAQYEAFRIIGFPAIVEHHLTAGVGVNLTKKVSVNLGYMHAFENSIKESSLGNAITYESKLHEDSYELGLNFIF
ncbi:MAG: outer membrane protein transport protein [Nitrospirota bacterium]